MRIEGAALLAAAVTFYAVSGASWWLFVILLLAPDLSMLAYAGGPRLGAYVYNVCHSTVGALALLAGGYVAGAALPVSLGLIWLAHIGMDRALGYGLKEVTAFRDTHLGRIGRD